METTTFDNAVNDARKQIKSIAKYVKDVKDSKNKDEVSVNEDRGEVLANLTLCYRHLEDASMRLGKVLQAYDGGVSVYDKGTTVGA
jgi:hypothetical protein